jgi:hypothetical protein
VRLFWILRDRSAALENFGNAALGPNVILARDRQELADFGEVPAIDERTLLAAIGAVLVEQFGGEFAREG